MREALGAAGRGRHGPAVGAAVSISVGSGAASSWVEPSVMSAPSSMAGSSVAAVASARLELLAMRLDDLLGEVRRARPRSGRASRERAAPWASERSSVAYENSSACGHVRGDDLHAAVGVHARGRGRAGR